MSLKIKNGIIFDCDNFLDLQNLIDRSFNDIKKLSKIHNNYNISKQVISAYFYSLLSDNKSFMEYSNHLDLFELSHNFINIRAKSLNRINLLTYLSESSMIFSMSDKMFDFKSDTSLSLFIFPLKDKIIGYHNSNNPIISNLIKKEPFISDYYYVNSFWESPKNIDEQEWIQRRNDWEDYVFSTPYKKPFKYDIISPEKVFTDNFDYLTNFNPEVQVDFQLDLNDIINQCCAEYSFFCRLKGNSNYSNTNHINNENIKNCKYFKELYDLIKRKIKTHDWKTLLSQIIN